MKRSTIILAVGVLTFMVGVTTVAVLKIRRSEKDQNTQIPIPADSALCDLIQNPSPYESQSVHVAANLIGYHEIALYGASCKREDNYVRAEFGQASRQKLIQGIEGLDGGGLQRGNFWAHVVLRGRFEKILESDRVTPLELDAQHKYIQYRYRLVVSEVEKVVAVSDDVPWW